MDSRTKVCIVNSHTNDSWYPQGQKRLERSLLYHGYAHDLFFVQGWANDNYDKSNPVSVKQSAVEEALKGNYDIIIWMDCSFWALQSIYPICDIICRDGYYFWQMDLNDNCAQITSDKVLDYFDISRDTAETYSVVGGGFWGVHTHNPSGQMFLNRWITAAKEGGVTGTKDHSNQSSDPRFLYHRPDTSVTSIIVNQLGAKTHGFKEHIEYYKPVMADTTILTLRGL